jgi:hypothetical protein
VLNGIAYDQQTGRLFVTGKNWPNLYEITIKPAFYGALSQKLKLSQKLAFWEETHRLLFSVLLSLCGCGGF